MVERGETNMSILLGVIGAVIIAPPVGLTLGYVNYQRQEKKAVAKSQNGELLRDLHFLLKNANVVIQPKNPMGKVLLAHKNSSFSIRIDEHRVRIGVRKGIHLLSLYENEKEFVVSGDPDVRESLELFMPTLKEIYEQSLITYKKHYGSTVQHIEDIVEKFSREVVETIQENKVYKLSSKGNVYLTYGRAKNQLSFRLFFDDMVLWEATYKKGEDKQPHYEEKFAENLIQNTKLTETLPSLHRLQSLIKKIDFELIQRKDELVLSKIPTFADIEKVEDDSCFPTPAQLLEDTKLRIRNNEKTFLD